MVSRALTCKLQFTKNLFSTTNKKNAMKAGNKKLIGIITFSLIGEVDRHQFPSLSPHEIDVNRHQKVLLRSGSKFQIPI